MLCVCVYVCASVCARVCACLKYRIVWKSWKKKSGWDEAARTPDRGKKKTQRNNYMVDIAPQIAREWTIRAHTIAATCITHKVAILSVSTCLLFIRVRFVRITAAQRNVPWQIQFYWLSPIFIPTFTHRILNNFVWYNPCLLFNWLNLKM